MKTINQLKKYMAIGAGAGVLALASPLAGAVEVVTLCAGETTIDMGTAGSPAPVTMWGFGEMTGAMTVADCLNSISVPGPEIRVPAGETSLQVNLHNTLQVPVSMIIQGQPLPIKVGSGLTNVPDMNANGRVRSLVPETAPGTMGTYSFEGVQSGSHVYHSATHQQVQVQMGLYGAMIKDAAAGAAYQILDTDGITVLQSLNYDNEVILFYSEVDPALHQLVANTVFPAYAATGYTLELTGTSTLNYQPRFSLVNGQPVDVAAAGETMGSAGALVGSTDILVRMFNAGLRSHYPQSLGARMKLVAENGHLLSHAKDRATVGVHPLGTTDIVLRTAQTGGQVSIVDRRLHLNDGTTSRGMVTKLDIALNNAASSPVAANDAFDVAEDSIDANLMVSLNDTVGAAPAVITIEDAPAHGTATVSLAGTGILYTPAANYVGTDVLTYSFVNADNAQSNTAVVNINVTPVNDGVIAVADVFAGYANSTLIVPAPGVLANDTDVDGDAVLSLAAPVAGVTLGADGSLEVVIPAGQTTPISFDYNLADALSTATATVTVNILAGAPSGAPIAAQDTLAYSRGAADPTQVFVGTYDAGDPTAVPPVLPSWTTMPIDIAGMLGNDVDPDDSSFPAGATIALPFSTQRLDPVTGLPVTDAVVVNGNPATRVYFDGLTQMGGSTIVLANDLDAAGNIVQQTLSYTPVLNGLGTDEFLYLVTDRHGNVSNTALVRVNIIE